MSFVRLDFRDPTGPPAGTIVRPTVETICAMTLDEVPACIERLNAVWNDGLHAAGFISYEAAPAIEPSLAAHAPTPGLPLLWFIVSDTLEAPASMFDVERSMLNAQSPLHDDWQAEIDADTYEQRFDAIQQAIRDGETYQMNFTFPLRAAFDGDSAGVYAAMRSAQSANYAAWLHSDDWDIISASPELFFNIDRSRITTRPMKGTRRRGMTTAADRRVAAELADSAKDRAENVMIVDLLRNDLGRVARTGSVVVDDLFRIEKYPTVWQMTSRVSAELRNGVGLQELLAALFPCGSVTGAPKAHTMSLIKRHEDGPRGVYCGAIGYLGPNNTAVFNVPIRTLTLGGGKAVYPIGSGLVSDSDAAVEYRECLDKARVLQRASAPVFEIFETMLYQADDQSLTLLDRHLARLAESADYFDYPYDPGRVQAALLGEELAHGGAGKHREDLRVRLLLAVDGSVRVETTPMAESVMSVPRRVTLGRVQVDSQDVFLYHKTTNRTVYHDALAAAPEADDVILLNERGELTESCYANIALKIDGEWLTPPISCGLLAGTLRAELLAAGELREAVLTPDDLQRAEVIELLNSVRGRMEAVLLD